jgi:phage shock protein A
MHCATGIRIHPRKIPAAFSNIRNPSANNLTGTRSSGNPNRQAARPRWLMRKNLDLLWRETTAMIRKLFLFGGGAALVCVLVFGRSALSYVRTAGGFVSQSAQEAVPIEFQIERARGMIQDLVPEVRKNMHIIAKEEIDVQRLDEQISDAEARQAKEKEQVLRLKTDLAENKETYSYAGRTYTANEVRTDLANRFERFKTNDATLASLKEIRNARQKSLTAARQKLEGMLASKRQLQVQVENLEARVQMVAAAKTTSNYQFDDSRLGQVKELVAGLRSRLDVAEKLVNAETTFDGEIPLDKATPANITEQVGEYFSDKTTVATTAMVAKNVEP